MSLEEPANADASGLKSSLNKSLSKPNLCVPHKHCEIGVCTDGAPVNVAMYHLVNAEVSEYYMLTLCTAHKIELAILDVFKESALNNMCSQNYVNIFTCFDKRIYDGGFS